MKKLFIIGAGPAGISAALYAKRGGVDTSIIYMQKSSLNIAHKIDNYYGVGSISGSELFEKGLKQAEELGINLYNDEVISVEYDGSFNIICKNSNYNADALIIATGAYRNSPNIKNIKAFEGKGVSYCATCDGFFYRKKRIAVLGNSSYALHETEYLKNLSSDIHILTNGEKIVDEGLKAFDIIDEKIIEIKGDEKINAIHFANDKILEIDGLFVALGSAGSADLAKKLGLELDNNKIVTNENMQTNIPGLYACGDCTKGMLQVAKAVYEGAKAGSDAIIYLTKLKKD